MYRPTISFSSVHYGTVRCFLIKGTVILYLLDGVVISIFLDLFYNFLVLTNKMWSQFKRRVLYKFNLILDKFERTKNIRDYYRHLYIFSELSAYNTSIHRVLYKTLIVYGSMASLTGSLIFFVSLVLPDVLFHFWNT